MPITAPPTPNRAVLEHATWLAFDPRPAGDPELAVAFDALVGQMASRDGIAGEVFAAPVQPHRANLDAGFADEHELRTIVAELEPFGFLRAAR